METGGTKETSELTHGIFLGPGASCFLVAGSLSLIEVCNFWYKWVIRVRVGKEGADRQENFRDCQSRAPLLLQNVQAYTSIWVYVWVVHLHFSFMSCISRDTWIWGIVMNCTLSSYQQPTDDQQLLFHFANNKPAVKSKVMSNKRFVLY